MRYLLFVVLEVILIVSGMIVVGSLPSLHQQRGREGSVLDCSDPTGTYYREAIPSIDEPAYESVSEAERYLDNGDRIIGFSFDGVWYGYPVRILNRHEIVNDLELGLAVTYCPLTGSPLVYPLQQLDGSTIGVTGYLFETNLVFYDRHTDSCFVQMLSLSLSGERLGQRLDYIPTVDLFWDDWVDLFPESRVLSRDSGFDEAYYTNDQYRSYSTDESILYPANFLDQEPYNLYHPKVRTLVLELVNETFLFPAEEFGADMAVQFSLEGDDYVVFHDNSSGLMQAFKGNEHFTPIRDAARLRFVDGTGLEYTIMGTGVNHEGNLEAIPNFVSYWYAAIVFFPNSNIFTATDFLNYDVAVGDPYVVVPAQNAGERFFIFGILVILVISFSLALRWLRKKVG